MAERRRTTRKRSIATTTRSIERCADGRRRIRERFRAWFAEWRAGGSSGARVAALVDAAVAKRFEKTSSGKRDE